MARASSTRSSLTSKTPLPRPRRGSLPTSIPNPSSPTLSPPDLDDVDPVPPGAAGYGGYPRPYAGLVAALEKVEADPMSGRSRDLFRKGMRSVNYGRYIIFFSPVDAAGEEPVVLRILHQRRHLPVMIYYDDLDGA